MVGFCFRFINRQNFGKLSIIFIFIIFAYIFCKELWRLGKLNKFSPKNESNAIEIQVFLLFGGEMSQETLESRARWKLEIDYQVKSNLITGLKKTTLNFAFSLKFLFFNKNFSLKRRNYPAFFSTSIGKISWTRISFEMSKGLQNIFEFPTDRQCKERWFNHLNPQLKKF